MLEARPETEATRKVKKFVYHALEVESVAHSAACSLGLAYVTSLRHLLELLSNPPKA